LNSSPLRRVLGAAGLTSVGIGGTIGTGIFVMTGEAARDVAGPAVLVSFVIAAIACAGAALCYARLAARHPQAGSAYAYARAVFPPSVAFLIGWNMILQYVLAAASIGQGWSHYFQDAVAALGGGAIPLPVRGAAGSPAGAVIDLPALLAVLAMTGLILRGITPSIRVNHAVVVVKMLLIALILGIGVFHFNPANWAPFAPFGWGMQTGPGGNPQGMLAGAAVVFYAFLGFEAMTNYSEDSHDPHRDIPRSMLWALGISTLVYLAMTAVLTGMVPYQAISQEAPVSEAFGQVGMPWIRTVVATGALIAITNVLLVILLSLPRVFMAISRDGILSPTFWGFVSPAGVPSRATWAGGLLIALLSALVPLNTLGIAVVMANLLTFIVVATLAWRQRLGVGAPAVAVLMSVGLLAALPWFGWILLAAWWLIGVGVYVWRRPREKEIP